MEISISEISLNSKKSSALASKPKQGSSTRNDSQLLFLDSLQSHPTQQQSIETRSEASRHFHRKIATIEAAQKELVSKFERVKENLAKEIQKKEELNCLLEADIAELKAELQEGRKDLGIIASYLKKKAGKQPELHRKTLLNSTKGSAKIQKSVENSNEMTKASSGSKRVEKKSRSPRMVIIKH